MVVASSRTERVFYWVAAATIVAGLAVGSLALASAWPPKTVAFAFTGFQVPLAIAFGGMGLLLVRRRPGNRIGWLLVLEAVMSTIHFAFDQLAIAGLPPGSPASEPLVAWISNWIWLVAISPLPVVFLLFPDGRALSPRWGAVIPTLVVGVTVAIVGHATEPGSIANYPTVQSPLTIGGAWSGGAFLVGGAVFLAASAASVFSLVIRWRRSSGDEREQLKWLAFVGIPMIAVAPFSPAVPIAADVLIGFGVAMPVAIGIAVLRHRLYDIDELIGRAVVYGALTAILAGLYTAALRLFNELFVQLTGAQSESSIILATLVLAAAFTPVRKALEGIVERRFKPAAGHAAIPAGAALATLTATELETLVRRAVREELAAGAARKTQD
jgi:hypothetical protein